MLPGQPGRRAGQVVRGDRGQAVGAPVAGRQRPGRLLGVVAFEPQDGRAEHAPPGQLRTDHRLDRPQVLPDDGGARAVRLQGEDGEHRLGVVPHVRALRRRPALRHPPQPEQAHDVVDAQGARVPQHAAQQTAVRGVALGGQRVRPPGRQAPVLAARVEGVRRRAHGHAGREGVLLGPGVGPGGVDADGQVVHQPDAHPGLLGGALGGGELLVGEPREAAVEVDAVQQAAPHPCGPGRARVVQAGGPGAPVGPVQLGQRAPGGVVLQARALLGEEVAVGGAPPGAQRHLPEQLQRFLLQLPHGVPVDQRALAQHRLAQRPGPYEQRVEPGSRRAFEAAQLGDVLDAQVDGVGEAAGGGAVRRGVGGRSRYGGVQRVDLYEAAAERASGPGGQVGEVAQVPHAPGAAGEQGVQLHHEAVGAAGRRGHPVGGDDQVGAGGAAVGRVGAQGVDAEGETAHGVAGGSVGIAGGGPARRAGAVAAPVPGGRFVRVLRAASGVRPPVEHLARLGLHP